MNALQGISSEGNEMTNESVPSDMLEKEENLVDPETDFYESGQDQQFQSEPQTEQTDETEWVLPVRTEFRIEEAEGNEGCPSNSLRMVRENIEPEYSSVSSIELSTEMNAEIKNIVSTKSEIMTEEIDEGEYIPKITIEPPSKEIDPELYKDFRVPESLIINGKNCAICGKGFKRKNNVKVHIETIHYEIKRYKCEENGCDKRFAQVSHLNVHMQAHRRRELRLQQLKRSILLNKTPKRTPTKKKQLTFSKIIPKIILQKKDRNNYRFKLSELFPMKEKPIINKSVSEMFKLEFSSNI